MAQSIAAPTLKEGDSWTYVDTIEKAPGAWSQTHDTVTLQRATNTHIYYSTQQVGSTNGGRETIAEADWGRVREIDGNEVVVNRPLSFPLTIGKTWEVQYTESHPNARVSKVTWTHKYRVVGYEDVEVPAGKFHALKIEAEGGWRGDVVQSNTVVQAAQTQPGATTVVTQAVHAAPEAVAGRTYEAIWYVPEVGCWVKSVEEYYNGAGVRYERYAGELEAYKRSGK